MFVDTLSRLNLLRLSQLNEDVHLNKYYFLLQRVVRPIHFLRQLLRQNDYVGHQNTPRHSVSCLLFISFLTVELRSFVC